jgi:hypothetical protein
VNIVMDNEAPVLARDMAIAFFLWKYLSTDIRKVTNVNEDPIPRTCNKVVC